MRRKGGVEVGRGRRGREAPYILGRAGSVCIEPGVPTGREQRERGGTGGRCKGASWGFADSVTGTRAGGGGSGGGGGGAGEEAAVCRAEVVEPPGLPWSVGQRGTPAEL